MTAGRLARNLRTLREARGVTQAQLARLAGIPRATWAHLESGEANPTLGVMNYLVGLVGLGPYKWVSNAAVVVPALVVVDTWEWTPLITLGR